MWSFRAEGTPHQVEDATEESRNQGQEIGLAKQAEVIRQTVLGSIDEMVQGQEADCRIGVAAEITHRRGHEDEMEYRVEIIFKAIPPRPDIAQDQPQPKPKAKAQPQDHSQDQDPPQDHAPKDNGKSIPNGKKLDQPTKPVKNR